MDKNIGKKLDGRYEITELIGIGGMADVYKATDLIENRTVAVKILKNEYADNDDFVRRFRNESKAIAVMSHPNIVKIFDVGFSDRIQFIVMEYIDGITLKEFIEQQGALKWKDSVHFIIQILRALQHAHDRGIVHRDIKPQNIMLFPDGTIKVMDFGIARFAREEGKTISDKAIGSVHYISPEQARGDITDEKSDIYSVGVMLYEMLTGVKPFDGDSPIAIALMHMQTSPKSPREINDTIPEGLEAIVKRAMQCDAQKRYQSASEMIKDIEEFKKNPSIVFEYTFPTNIQPEEKTQYFDKPQAVKKEESEPEQSGPRYKEKPTKSQKAANNEVRTTKTKKTKEQDYELEDYDDYDDEDEEVSKTSYFVVALSAITAAVIIIAVVFIAMKVAEEFIEPPKDTQDMINLVGYDYNTCKSTYSEYFELIVDSQQYNSDYPAGAIISHTPKEGSPIIVGSAQVRAVVSKGPQMIPIPNVYQLEANTAGNMIESYGLKYSIVMQNSDADENTVIKTEPERNTEVEKGSVVILYVSMGPEIYDVVMPDVIDMNVADAEVLLKSKGFAVQMQEKDSAKPLNTVIEQSIPHLDAAGQENIVSPNQTVILYYSSGKAPMTEINITFAVPDGLDGKAVFNAYVNGNLSGTLSIDNIGYVSTVSVPVQGKDTQKVILETVDETGEKYNIAEYNIDFNNLAVAEVRFDKELLKKIYGDYEEPVITEPLITEPNVIFPDETQGGFNDPANDYEIIGGNQDYNDWWNEIMNGQ